MTPRQVLRYVRLPLAAPVIMAGYPYRRRHQCRHGHLAAFIGAGGLGDPIAAGLALSDTRMILPARCLPPRLRCWWTPARCLRAGGHARPVVSSLTQVTDRATPSLRRSSPQSELAPQVAAVPYDVVSRDEAVRAGQGNPDSFLHVGRSDIDLPDDIDPHDPRIYAGARGARPLVAQGVLIRDGAPALYLYRQIMDGRAQTGLVGCVHVDDYEQDIIRKHEKTRQDKEDDRTRHVLTLEAHAEPVFLTYRGRARSTCSPTRLLATRAALRLHGAGRRAAHRLADLRSGAVARCIQEVPRAYVADGHHRSASAWRAGGAAAANPRAPGRRGVQLVSGGAVSRPISSDPALQSRGSRPRRRSRRQRCSRHCGGSAGCRRQTILARPGRGTSASTWRGLAPGRARREDDRPHAIRSARSTSRCCRTGCSAPSSASAIRAPTSGSTSWAASAGTAELERRVDSGEMAIAFSLFPRRWISSWPSRTPAPSCRRRAPGSSPSCGVGSLCIPFRGRVTESQSRAQDSPTVCHRSIDEGFDRGQVREGGIDGLKDLGCTVVSEPDVKAEALPALIRQSIRTS